MHRCISGAALWVVLLAGFNLYAQPILVTNNAVMAGQSTYDVGGVVTISAFNGETAPTPNALINSSDLTYIGVDSDPGDANVNAVNDRGTTAGGSDRERLRLEIATGHYLSDLTWQWSRADGPLATDGVTISGFNSDPGAVFSGGVVSSPAPSYSAGKLNFQITGFSGTIHTIAFANPAASTNATLEITVADSDQAGPQLAIRNFSIGSTSLLTKRVNLARYQATTASDVNGQYLAGFATDGVVGNGNSWRTDNVSTPHWAEVAFPVPVTIRSAHVYNGINDGSLLAGFSVQYKVGASWVNIPGSVRVGNTSSEVNVIFSVAVTSDHFRLYTDDDGNQRVKEFALFPPNPNPTNGVEMGFPIGTDVELNLAHRRSVIATSTSGANYPNLAVDGHVSGVSQWRTSLVGSNSLEIDLRVSTKIGSAHLYSGDGGVPPIADFVLQYWTGSAWANISGGAVSGNTEAGRVVDFGTEPTTSRVQLVFTNNSASAVRELCIFPANNGAGYPIGQEISFLPPPTQRWNDYSDAYYNIRNRAANLSASIVSNTPSLNTSGLSEDLSHYQVLLNVGTETYRLRNRVIGKCLAGAGLSTNVGALLVEEDYTAMPHQNWTFTPVDGTDFYLVNEWSGLVLDTQGGNIVGGTPLVQNTNDLTASQRWRFEYQTHYPKKGTAGWEGSWSQFKANWSYNWGRATGASLPVHVTFNPMQWGNFNWDIGSNQGPLEQFISEWKRQEKAMHFLGFNEPDAYSQSGQSLDPNNPQNAGEYSEFRSRTNAVRLWPRMERMNVPLISPVTKNPLVSWMTDFMNDADASGYRIDGMGVHKYPGPNGGDPGALISELQSVYNTWDRPVWFTEFSTVDWTGTGTWTEEDNYNWLAEFMWRAESLSWLRRYSLFLFSANAGNPTPTNPWDPVAPRSNAFESNGSTPTSFGELYFAWDGDANVREDKAYVLHNKGERKRIQNNVGSSVPGHGWIRDGGNTVQWVLRPSGVAGQWYIVSLRDGRRLRYSGGMVDFAPAHITDSSVRWNWIEDQHGWFYIENPAAPASNRRLKDIAGAFSMVSSGNTGDPIKWRFVVPYVPVETSAPATPANLNATAGVNQVMLTWDPSGAADFSFYSVYRSVTPGGGYSLIASNLVSASHLDATLPAGTTYYYVVTATDWVGYESGDSAEQSATPVPPWPSTPTHLGYTVSNSSLVLSWPSNYTGWLLQVQTNELTDGLDGNWSTLTSSSNNNSFVMPINKTDPAVFYRLKLP